MRRTVVVSNLLLKARHKDSELWNELGLTALAQLFASNAVHLGSRMFVHVGADV